MLHYFFRKVFYLNNQFFVLPKSHSKSQRSPASVGSLNWLFELFLNQKLTNRSDLSIARFFKTCMFCLDFFVWFLGQLSSGQLRKLVKSLQGTHRFFWELQTKNISGNAIRHDISMVFLLREGERWNDGTPPPPPFFLNLDQRTMCFWAPKKPGGFSRWSCVEKNRRLRLIMKDCMSFCEENLSYLSYFGAKKPWFSSTKKPSFPGRSFRCFFLLPGCQVVTRMTPYMFRILGIPKKTLKNATVG